MARFDGKGAIITGSASGMGRAAAARLAGEGGAVGVADVSVEGGAASVLECKHNGGRAIFQKTDVSAEAEIKALVARAVKEFGRLDITWNNAGIGGAGGPLEQITVEDCDRSQAVLLRGVFLGIKHSVPEMRKVGGGSIISTASIAGIQGYVGIHAYSAAKAGVINLTRSASAELAKDKIRVNCICPGGINTPLIHGALPGGEATGAQLLSRMQPMQREGRPDDIANMALFLASDESEWITGTAMVVDGGFTAVGNFFQCMGQSSGAGILPSDGYAGPSFERPKV